MPILLQRFTTSNNQKATPQGHQPIVNEDNQGTTEFAAKTIVN